MLKYLSAFLSLFFFIGCTSNKTKEEKEIEQLKSLGVKTIVETIKDKTDGYFSKSISFVDEDGRVIKMVIKESGTNIEISYEGDKMKKMIRKTNNTVDFEKYYWYDDKGNLIKDFEKSPGWRTSDIQEIESNYEYDMNGKIIKYTFGTITYVYDNFYSNQRLRKVKQYSLDNFKKKLMSEDFYNENEQLTKSISYEEGRIREIRRISYNSLSSLLETEHAQYIDPNSSRSTKYFYTKDNLLKSSLCDETGDKDNPPSIMETTYEYTFYPKKNYLSFLEYIPSYLRFWEPKQVLSLENPTGIVGTIWAVTDKYGNVLNYYKFHDSVFVKLHMNGDSIDEKLVLEWQLINGNDLEDFQKQNGELKLNPAIIELNERNARFYIIQKNETYYIANNGHSWGYYDGEFKLVRESNLSTKVIGNLNSIGR